MIQSHIGGVGKIFAVFVLISSHTPAAFVLRNFTKLTWRTGAEDVSRRRLIIPERAKLAGIWSLSNGIASIVLHKLTILISQVPSAQNPAAQDDSRNGSRQWRELYWLTKNRNARFLIFFGVNPGWTWKPRTAMRLAKYFMLDSGMLLRLGVLATARHYRTNGIYPFHVL